MARETINLGTPPNGADGDTIRIAMDKCNDNFEELYLATSFTNQISGRNMLINCGIPINQRGFVGGSLAEGVYGYDRWKAGAGGCNFSINQSSGVFSHNSGSIVQIIENPLAAWGNPITVSVEDPNSQILIDIGGTTGIIDSGLGRRSVTLIPVGSGDMKFQITASSATYKRPQVERGSIATEFDYRSYSSEVMLCQRYFEKSFNMGTPPSPTVSGGDSICCSFSATTARSAAIEFKVSKRTTPSMTLYTNDTVVPGTGQWVIFNGAWSKGTAAPSSISETGFTSDISFPGGLTPYSSYPCAGHWVADAEIY